MLDLKLPGKDGLDVCRTLRRDSDVPSIMLTARVEETDRLIGLELGADDYITKPFSPRELVARVRAVLRRVQGSVRQPGLILVADIEIDLNGRRVTRKGEAITLTRSEFNLLVMLAQHPGQAFTREQLLTRLYDVAYDGFARSIDAHIKSLRQRSCMHLTTGIAGGTVIGAMIDISGDGFSSCALPGFLASRHC